MHVYLIYLLCAAIALVSIKLFKAYQSFQKLKLEFPGPEPSFIFGNILDILRCELASDGVNYDWRIEFYQKYGPIYQIFGPLGSRISLTIAEPEMIDQLLSKQNIPKAEMVFPTIDLNTYYTCTNVQVKYRAMQLLTGEGILADLDQAHWKFQRKTLNAAFAGMQIRPQLKYLEDRLGALINIIDGFAASSTQFDMDSYLVRLTLDFIGRFAFDESFNALENGELAAEIPSYMHKVSKIIAKYPLIPSLVRWLFPSHYDMMDAAKRLRARIQSIIQKRRQMLVDAEPGTQKKMLIDLMIESDGFTDAMIADNSLTFLFAGHDTTAHTMAYAIYELFRNPAALQEVRKEIDAVLGEQRIATSEHLSQLECLEKALKETLRIHPVALGTVRENHEPLDINGVVLPKGSWLSFYNRPLHMDSKYFAEPYKFKLDRWNVKPTQGTFFPFSLGARDCIGKDLAMKEAKMAVATLLKNFDFVFDPDWKLKKTTQLSVVPVNGVPVVAKRRVEPTY